MNTPDQHTLFKLQKWHLKIALRNEVNVRIFDRQLRKPHLSPEVVRFIREDRRSCLRRAKLHHRFVDCITPFVRLPL